jgi:hypothetical protein
MSEQVALSHAQLVAIGRAAHDLAVSTDLTFEQACDTLGLVALAAEQERRRIEQALDAWYRRWPRSDQYNEGVRCGLTIALGVAQHGG